MRHTVSCGLPPSTIFSPHYLINGTVFFKKKFLNTKCVFRFSVQLLFEIFVILRRTERDVLCCTVRTLHTLCVRLHVQCAHCTALCVRLHVQCLLLLSGLNETWIFLDVFSKSIKISNFTKIVQWEPSCSMTTSSHLMLYREIIAVCSQIHTEHINTVCVGRTWNCWMLNWRYM